MGRPRKHRRDLPERVYFEDGRYRYRPLFGPAVELGVDEEAALKLWATVKPKRKPGDHDDLRSMGAIGDAYMEEIAPLKSPVTQRDNAREWKMLRPAFADLLPEECTQQQMHRYLAKRGAVTRGNREKALLCHMLSWCKFLGKIEHNPLYGMQKRFAGTSETPRTRLVTDKELATFVAAGGEKLVLYCDLKNITRLRKGDLLTLEVTNIKDEGLELTPRKSRRRNPRTGEAIGRPRIFMWRDWPELRPLIDRILELKRQQELRTGNISPWLFATLKGKCYYNRLKATAEGFRTIWDDCMARAKKLAAAQGWELEHFTEHDLRARKGGSAHLLGNTEGVFKKHYDRGAEVVQPLRRT